MANNLLGVLHALVIFMGTVMVGFIGGLTIQSILMSRKQKEPKPAPTWVGTLIGVSYGILGVSALIATWYADYKGLKADPIALIVNILRAIGFITGLIAVVTLVGENRYRERKEDDVR